VFVLLGAVLACQTPATGPHVVCAGAIRVVPEQVQHSIALRISNDCFVPVLLEVSFPELVNMRSTEPVPLQSLVAATAEQPLTTLQWIDPGEQARYGIAFVVLHWGAAAPAPESTYRYPFPFGGSEARRLVQGADGSYTHQGSSRYAYDFGLPRGTPVLAARDGIVLMAVDGFPDGGPDPKYKNESNSVHVLHSDGTVAGYGHLSSGLHVRMGDQVSAGELLGLSGNSGYSRGPHLHFQVDTQRPRVGFESIPIQFLGAVGVSEGNSYGPYDEGRPR
jgi:murein DD-endopeptidase MepM/ murein hydrolase activator NlpD